MADMGYELWRLLVGSDGDLFPRRFLSPLILSSVTKFRDGDSASTLFAAARRARRSVGVLKDDQLALWLIDRLRIGVGWEQDLSELNGSFTENDPVELQAGISSTTVLMALLECFDPSEVSVRCALLHMAARCKLPLPVVANVEGLGVGTATRAFVTEVLVSIGGLAYAVPPTEQSRMVLLLSTYMDDFRREQVFRTLFPLDERLVRDQGGDIINQNMLKLYVNTPLSKGNTGSTQNCQILISSGQWDDYIGVIGPLIDAVPVIILNLNSKDVVEDGSLQESTIALHPRLQEMVSDTNEGRLICIFNGSPSRNPTAERAAEQNRVKRFCEKYQVDARNCFLLPDNLRRSTPNLRNTCKQFVDTVLGMVNGAQVQTGVPWLGMQGDPKMQSVNNDDWLKPCDFAAKVRQALDDLKIDTKESELHLRKQMFPFSQAAQKAAVSRNKRATKLRRGNANADHEELLQIDEQEHKDFMEAANATPHPFFRLFLSHLMSPQDMYFFERELEVWKSTGAVAKLQIDLENTKQKLDKALQQRSRDKEQLQREVEAKYAQLDEVDWSPSDFWREIRTIKGLPKGGLLQDIVIEMVKKKYDSVFIPKEEQKSIARMFKELFCRGRTLDVLDGNLLSVDEEFLNEVFDPRLSQENPSGPLNTSENYFVISMLGVQSTGKSTLLNNLFGCNLPVSVGRTTRGMNVCRVGVSLPGSSIKHLVVQDYEGLMTMDRNDSLFDKDVCLQALATSDLVLVNTSKVIDSPTQQLLQYAAFAFHELGLQKYRKLKPKLAFVLRDMASGDISALVPAKRAMEAAILNGFKEKGFDMQNMDPDVGLSNFMDMPEYLPLGSAVNRQEGFWQTSLLGLRMFIFNTMTELDKEGSSQGRSFNNWVVYGVASWNCIRTNTGLLFAKSLAELRLKNQMEKALQKALNSQDTNGIIKSENKIKEHMDLILKNEETIDHLKDDFSKQKKETIDRLKDEFSQQLDKDFAKCLESVKKEFVVGAGPETSVSEALVETWRDFHNFRIDAEVLRHKNQMRQVWEERLRLKEIEVSMSAALDAAVKALVDKTRAGSDKKMSQVEAAKRFTEVLAPEEQKFKSFVTEQYSAQKITRNIDDIYALVCSKIYIEQPNDFDDLIDGKKEDLTPEEKGGRTGNRPLSSPDKIVKDKVTTLQNKLKDEIIPLFSISASSLRNDIETAVQKINDEIRLVSKEGSGELDEWMSQVAKAAHRHLYRDIIGRVRSLSERAIREQMESFADMAKGVKEHYMAEVTGQVTALELCKQITMKLSNALFKWAINPAHLNLQANDLKLLSHFAICSSKMVEEKCYDSMFKQRNDDLLLKYIKDRSGTTRSIWDKQYKIGEGIVRKLSYKKINNIFLGSGSDFEKLKTATEDWFRQNDGMRKEPVGNLLNKLNGQFEFLRSDGTLVALGISSIDKVSSSIIKSLWPEAVTMCDRARIYVDKHVNDLRAPIKKLTKGCTQTCLLCKAKCKYPAGHVVSHECHRHLITGFGGCWNGSNWGNRVLNTSHCTWSVMHGQWFLDNTFTKKETPYENLAKTNPTWKIVKTKSVLAPLEQRQALKRLNKKIAAHFGLKPANEF